MFISSSSPPLLLQLFLLLFLIFSSLYFPYSSSTLSTASPPLTPRPTLSPNSCFYSFTSLSLYSSPPQPSRLAPSLSLFFLLLLFLLSFLLLLLLLFLVLHLIIIILPQRSKQLLLMHRISGVQITSVTQLNR